MWSKSPNYSVTNISDLQMASIITLSLFAAVFMIQLACLMLPTTTFSEARIGIVNMYSNLRIVVAGPTELKKTKGLSFWEYGWGKRWEHSGNDFSQWKRNQQHNLWKSIYTLWGQKIPNPRFMFDYIFKPHAIVFCLFFFLKYRVNTGWPHCKLIWCFSVRDKYLRIKCKEDYLGFKNFKCLFIPKDQIQWTLKYNEIVC